MEFFERKSYSLAQGTDESLEEFVKNNDKVFDNKSHVVRCAIISFFREQRKKGRYINKVSQ